MMTRPWLSIVMPTFDGRRYVAGALESVVCQTAGTDELEVIVVDDGSTDDTLEVVRCFADRLPLRVFERPHGGNWAAATNIGMREARGEWVCWLHQDDAWCDDRLEVLRNVLAQRSDAELLLHPSLYVDADGGPLGMLRCPLPGGLEYLAAADVLPPLVVQCFITTCGAVFRRGLMERAGVLDEDLWYSADWDWWLRLARLGRAVHVPEPLTRFRLHRESQTARRIHCVDDYRRQHETVLRRHLPAVRELAGLPRADRRTERAARWSADVNVALAAWLTGGRPGWRRLFGRLIALGPIGALRYVKHSRIMERAVSRWRAGATAWTP